MGALVLAALSAVAYGVSDFVGGLRSRSAHPMWVTFVCYVVLLAGVLAWLPFRPGTPTPSDLVWGAVAGVGTGVGTMLLMRGLSVGAMHVAAPVAAVVAAALPVTAAVLTGERPAPLAWAGILAALPAVWLVAAGGSDSAGDESGGVHAAGLARGADAPEPGTDTAAPAASGSRRSRLPEGALDGALAGLAFAAFFYALSRTDPAAGGWPLVAVEVAAVASVGVLILVARPSGRLREAWSAWPMGVLAVFGTVLYFLAAQQGMLSLVVVVASLYPAFTVLLAMTVLREHPTRSQAVGLALAAGSVVLIALGGSA